MPIWCSINGIIINHIHFIIVSLQFFFNTFLISSSSVSILAFLSLHFHSFHFLVVFNLRLPQLYLNSTFFNSVSIPSTNSASYRKDRGFPDGSVVKNTPANVGASRDTGLILGLGWKDLREEEMLTHSSILARNPKDRWAWQTNAHGGHKELDMTEATDHACMCAYKRQEEYNFLEHKSQACLFNLIFQKKMLMEDDIEKHRRKEKNEKY